MALAEKIAFNPWNALRGAPAARRHEPRAASSIYTELVEAAPRRTNSSSAGRSVGAGLQTRRRRAGLKPALYIQYSGVFGSSPHSTPSVQFRPGLRVHHGVVGERLDVALEALNRDVRLDRRRAAGVEQDVHRLPRQPGGVGDVRARAHAVEHRQAGGAGAVEQRAGAAHVGVARVEDQRRLAHLQMRHRRFGAVGVVRVRDRPARQALHERVVGAARGAERRAAAVDDEHRRERQAEVGIARGVPVPARPCPRRDRAAARRDSRARTRPSRPPCGCRCPPCRWRSSRPDDRARRSGR